MTELQCSLCIMTFDSEDPLFNIRTERHDIWHIKSNVQHRNTTCGVPTYD